MAWSEQSLYFIVPLVLILFFVFCRGLTRNSRIQRQLKLGIFLLLAALSLELIRAAASGFDFPLPGKLGALELSRVMASRKQRLEAHGTSMGEDAATTVAVQEGFLNRIKRFFGL